jgi:hypothetical protein
MASTTSAAATQSPCNRARGPSHGTALLRRHARTNQQAWATGVGSALQVMLA